MGRRTPSSHRNATLEVKERSTRANQPRANPSREPNQKHYGERRPVEQGQPRLRQLAVAHRAKRKEVDVALTPVRQKLGSQGQQEVYHPEGGPRRRFRRHPHHVWRPGVERCPDVRHLALKHGTSHEDTQIGHPMAARHQQCKGTCKLQWKVMEEVD